MYLCLSCMNEIPEQGRDVCPLCGFSASSYHVPMHWLEAGSLLNQRYYIGKALRTDDYGISYNAYDVVMQRRVVIRQLMVRSRMPSDITMLRRDEPFFTLQHAESFYQTYREEADVEISSLPRIYTYGRCGNVLYAVEEFIPGATLAQYVKDSGAKSFDGTKKLLLPVIIALKLLQSRGVHHGNLTPDRIIKTDKSCVLVDLTGVDTTADDKNRDQAALTPEQKDVRHFLRIFLSVLYGSETMVDAAIINEEFFDRTEPYLPEDAKQYIYQAFHPEEQQTDISIQGVLNVIFKCGENAVGKKNQPIQAIPPKFLTDAAEASGMAVDKIITSVTG